MSTKQLTDYLTEMEEIAKDLSPSDLCVIAETFKNLTIRHNPEAFIKWAEPLVTRPPYVASHPHEAVLRAEIQEAKAY